MKHKYHAKRTEYKGRKFSSKLEASYCRKLEAAKASGELLFYLEQVPIRIDGGKYYIDFVEFWAPKNGEPGEIVWTEVKGYDLPAGKAKRKAAEERLPWIKINLVRKA